MLQFALVFFAGSKKNKQINGSLPFPFLVEKEQANSHSWLCLLWVRNKSICQWPSVLTRKKKQICCGWPWPFGFKQKHHEFIALAFWLRKIKQINPELLWPFGFPKIISKQ